jgi:hypothetical protein
MIKMYIIFYIVNIKKLYYNPRVEKINVPSHNTPLPQILFWVCNAQILTYNFFSKINCTQKQLQ